ncbi:MAG: enoyl-CoA hydratase/isomerase family protein [Rhizomicrobium sp.]
MTDEPDILFEKRGAAGLITLNRPRALNALTHGMVLALHAQLKAWAADDAVGCVVIQGAGERAFCAGGDIRALYESGKAGTPYIFDFYRDEYLLNAYIKHYPKPYIALIRGIVMGGGVGVSVHGAYRVADETTLFAMPETGIGLFPDVGGSFFLPRLPVEDGMYLGLTGARLKTADVVGTGIATHYVPNANREYLLLSLANGMAPDAAAGKYCETVESVPLFEHGDATDRIFSAPTVETLLARLEYDGSDWAFETAKTIRAKSPTATKLAFRQIREGAKLDFDDCMRMEFRMVSRVIAGHDFYEGVRATIIDKDGAPKWRPATLAEVSDADIDAYFAPLGEKELPL